MRVRERFDHVSADHVIPCSDDFSTFQLRRGRGCTTGNAGWTVPLPARVALNQYSDPSPGWRNDYDGPIDTGSLMRVLFQGPPNWWIDTTLNVLKYMRVDGDILTPNLNSRLTNDNAGPLMPRGGVTTYTTGAFQASASVLNGDYGGAYYMAEGWGLTTDVEQLAADFAVYDPVGLGGTVGLTFNMQTGSAGKSYYAVLARSQSGGANETGISVIKVTGTDTVTVLGKTTASSIAVNRADKVTMQLNGPRVWSRLHASKQGSNIKVWLNNQPGTIVLDVTDPGIALGPGMVGIMAIGVNGMVVDNILLVDTPSCTNGIMDGDETGVDCNGSCPSACPTGVQQYKWEALADGHYGMTHAQYGNSPNGAIFGVPIMYPDGETFMVMPSNANGNLPGSTGTNSAGWIGAWWMVQSAWPAQRDVDFFIDHMPGDNDWIGLTWRFIDRDNFYSLNTRTEVGSGVPKLTIQRRRNGRNTVLWASPTTYIEQAGATKGNPSWTVCNAGSGFDNLPRVPFNSCVQQRWRVRMIGARIELYMPPIDTFANLQTNALNPSILVSIVDTSPLMFSGQVGIICTSHDHWKVYQLSMTAYPFVTSPSAAVMALPVAPVNRAALTFGFESSSVQFTSFRAVEVVGDYSVNFRQLHTSPFMVAATTLPSIVSGTCGYELVFGGANFLYSHQSGASADPAIKGFTLVAVFKIKTAPVIGSKSVIASKGGRSGTYAAGWSLFVENKGAGLRLYFQAVSNNPADNVALISTPFTVGMAVEVAVVVTPDPATTGLTRIESRSFLVSAQLKNVTFDDIANNAYRGIISSGESADLFVGSLEDETSGMVGSVLELQTYGVPLPASDVGRLYGYMASRYNLDATTCPSLALAGLSNLTNFVTIAACTTPASGSVCVMSCTADSILIAGDRTVTCNNGEWIGRMPICAKSCPVSTATIAVQMDQKPCSYDLMSESWSSLSQNGISGCGLAPAAWISEPTGSVFSVQTPGRLTADPSYSADIVRVFASNSYVNFEPTMTVLGSGTIVQGSVPFPSSVLAQFDPNPTSRIEFYPRYLNPTTYYAVRMEYAQVNGITMGVTPLTVTTTLVRVLAGVSVTLCTAAPAALAYTVANFNVHSVTFFSSNQLTVFTNGVLWCNLPLENSVHIGHPGYGLSGKKTLDFGPIKVTQSFPFCTESSLRSTVPVGSNVTTSCNNGYASSGSNQRICQADGTLTGTPLVCTPAAPAVSNVTVTVPELAAEGTVVARFTSAGVARGSSIQYKIVGGNTGNAFRMGGCDGVVHVQTPSALDFEKMSGQDYFVLIIEASVLGSSPLVVTMASATISTTNVNDPPLCMTTACSVNENAAAGSTVCALNIVDVDTVSASFSATIQAQDVANVFVLAGTNLIVNSPGLNFEKKNTYSVTIRVVDNLDATSFSTTTVTVSVRDVLEAPVIAGPLIIQIPASALTTGKNLGQYIFAADEDTITGTKIVGYSLTTVGVFPALLDVNATTGELFSPGNTGPSYSLGSLTEKDGYIIADYSEVVLRATDNTPLTALTGSLNAKVYVMGDVSASSPVIRRVEVVAADATSGAGTSGLGVHVLGTAGMDNVNFYVDNMQAPAGAYVECKADTTDMGVRTWTTRCTLDGITNTGQIGPVASIVRCPTSASWGLGWKFALTRVDGSTRTPLTPTTSVAFTYGLPIISSVNLENTQATAMTTGGTALIVSGNNFAGGTGAVVVVKYGQANPVTGIVNWQFTLTVAGTDVAHTSIRGVTVAGDGSNLRFQVTVGGRTVDSDKAVTFSYGVPTIANITLLAGAAPLALNGAGGDVLVISGTNLGMGLTAMPILYYGPTQTGIAASPANLPMNTVTLSGVSTCTYAVVHTRVRCVIVAGLGKNLAAVISVGGGASAPAATRLSFASPVISAISGPGSRDMDTKGGQSFTLTGSNFGPFSQQGAGLTYPAPTVTYGPSSAPTRYTAVGCAVTGTGATSITCLTSEGSGGGNPLGSGFVFGVTAGNATSVPWQAPARCEYGSPKVNSVTVGLSMGAAGGAAAPFMTGLNAADTSGGLLVNIRGKNFGPFNESGLVNGLGYDVFYYTGVDLDGSGNLTTVRFQVSSCVRYSPTRDPLYLPLRQYHEQAYCWIAPGAGINIKWEMQVSGKVSIEPTTSYAEPVISAVSLSATQDVRVTAASDLGGDVVYLRGDFMGPQTSASLAAQATLRLSNFVQSVSYGPAGASGDAVYKPKSWRMTADHTTIEVVLAPGIGQNLMFQVSVADQLSAIPDDKGDAFTFDFILPVVTAIEPSNVSTASNTLVRVYVKNAGILDASTSHQITLDGADVPLISRFPSLADVRLFALGNLNLTAEQLDPNNHYLAFYASPGAGIFLPVVVTAYREMESSSRVSNDPAMESEQTWLNYSLPILDSASIEPVTSAEAIAAAATLYAGQDIKTLRLMTLVGDSFGPKGKLKLQLMMNDTFSDTSSGLVTEDKILVQTDTRISVLIDKNKGFARIVMEGTKPNAVAWSEFTPSVAFTDFSPAVIEVLGMPAGGFPTAGSIAAQLKVRNINQFFNLQVQVGAPPVNCPLYSLDGTTLLTAAKVFSDLIIPQAADQASRGILESDMVFTIGIRVPAGQGSANAIIVTRDGVQGSSSTTLQYAAPVITSIRLFTTAAVNASIPSSITQDYPFRVPTSGGDVYITGLNFGLCPVFFWGLLRGAVCARDVKTGDQLVWVSRSHTIVRFRVPEGAGGRGAGSWILKMNIGDQSPNALYTGYALPVVTKVTPVEASTGMTTLGGMRVNVIGANFGRFNSTLPIVTIVDPFGGNLTVFCSNDDRVWPRAVRSVTSPHSVMTCVLPEGSGAGLSLNVTVDDQSAVSAGAFSYDTPVVASVSNIDADFSARGNTPGGYQVLIKGNNFGPSNNSGHCVFLPYSGVALSSLLCNGKADSWDEYEVPTIKSWNHTDILLQMVAGMGAPVVRVHARGAFSVPAAVGSDVFTYNRPVITSVSPPTSDTDGGTKITIKGTNFGFGSTAAANAARTVQGYKPEAAQLPQPGQAGAFPSPYAMRVNFFTALRCISSSVIADTADNTAPASVQLCKREDTGYGVATHTHNEIVFKALPGVGKNRTLSVSIVGPDGAESKSNGVPFSYTAPSLTSAKANVFRMEAPFLVKYSRDDSPALKNYDADKDYIVQTVEVEFDGRNFGPISEDATWSDEEKEVKVTIGNRTVPSYKRVLLNDPRPRLVATYPGASIGYIQFFLAGTDVPTARQTVTVLPLNSVPTVGYKKVVAQVAGQLSLPHAGSLFQVVCDADNYGRPGEICDVCPAGARCDGYLPALFVQGSTPDNVQKYGTLQIVSRTTADGLNVTDCMTCHSQPRSLAGFYNMKGLLNSKGESESICSTLRKAEGKRTARECEYIVICEPPEACLADNVCADGYANDGFPYRCSVCADGFYRSAGNCRLCPTNPALNIVFFFIVAIAAIALGWFLNQKQINIAFLTIGLDYLQVISIFANTRIPWPAEIKELFRILSAFNLNIEIIAPECAFKGITYSQKWGMIMALPVGVNLLLLAVFAANVAYALIVKRQKKSVMAGMASPLVAMAQVLMYFLYLYITRSVFDVMTCRYQDPPEYDASGNAVLYMAGAPLIKCGVPGGVQLGLLPGAVAALLIYVLAYPAFIAWNLYTHRGLAMEDQLLRAKRTGDDRMSNPNALEFRRRWARTYYQFRPDMCLWVLAILGRKFLIAIASLIFNTNQNFQMAAMLLVLFVAYAAQVRFLPYMGPSTFDAVLRSHEDSARNGDVIHSRLLGIIANVEAQGRKRTFANTFNGTRQLTMSNLSGALAAFLFDYNTVEAVLLASALLVSLSGVMFGASESTIASSFYAESRKGVMTALFILVIASIVYWLVVVFVEVYVVINDRAATARTNAGKSAKSSKGKGKGLDGEESSGSSMRSDRAMAVLGAVENATNPMFLSKDGLSSSVAMSGMSVAAIQSMDTIPEGAVWMAVREAYVAQAERAAAVAEEVAKLKAEVGRARLVAAGSRRGLGVEDGSMSPRSPASQKKSAFGPQQAEGAVGGKNPFTKAKSSGNLKLKL